MEHHAGIYEQIIDANAANQESTLIPDHLVQEIIVQNDDQRSTLNCELPGLGIILSDDGVNLQINTDNSEQEKQPTNINLMEKCEKATNVNAQNESEKEQRVDHLILQNEASYQVADVNKSVPVINVNDSVPSLSNDQTLDYHDTLNNGQGIIDDLSIKEEQVGVSEKESENVILNEKVIENIKPSKVESVTVVSEVVSENVIIVMEEQISAENHCSSEKQEKYDDLKNEEVNSDVTEKVKNSELVEDSVKETNITLNSDDVAILTEFSTIEYIQSEISKKEEVKVDSVPKSHEVINSETAKNEQEAIDNMMTVAIDKEENKKNETSTYDQLANDNNDEEDEDELELHLSTQSTENHRKVIQDIFDDWQDENVEEENNQSSTAFKENHDSVELELQSLLNDGAQQEETVLSTSTESTEKSSTDNTLVKSRGMKSDKLSLLGESKSESKSSTPNNKSPKSVSNTPSTKDHLLCQSPKTSSQDSLPDTKHKYQSPRPGVKVPGLHLTSQIASTAEVNEALKERLREKQKDFVTPKTADIVFVKKITQRLSSQLSGAASVAVVPPLIPLQSTTVTDEEKNKDNKVSNDEDKLNKTSTTTADKELLAILEGDVDPDWSNLKSVTEESNKTSSSSESHSTGTKLDPVIERELALKQLLELPNIPTKKNNPVAPKKAKKSGRSSKSLNDSSESKSVDKIKTEVISLDSAEEDSPKKEKTPKALKENNNQNTRSATAAATIVELGVEESRSGRKRKLTEKAREHELSFKRQKILNKAKSGIEKKPSQELAESSKQKLDSDNPVASKHSSKTVSEANSPSSLKSSQIKLDIKQNKVETNQSKVETKTTPSKSETKQLDTKVSGIKGKMTPVKRPKIGLLKKDLSISKRKLAVKNLLRQKMVDKNQKSAAVKAKIRKIQSASTSKSATAIKTGSEKSPAVGTSTTKTKKVTEIDRLLQDEGVVNLLYDVEQPDSRKRLVPITKSQKKVMDVEKAERELKLRTKLVRNAVLRLRNSNTSTVKISPRSRRNISATEQLTPQSEKKHSEPNRSSKSPAPSHVPSDFIIPAKIRNAADASRIIRRHSSSSFSSASASPRVSIDMPPDSIKLDEPDVQIKSKRKLSVDPIEKVDTKKNKKKITSKQETENKIIDEKSPTKKESVKKITTRSNVVSATSISPVRGTLKNKKVPKNKASSESSISDVKSLKGQDELSACLAEAASALLSSINTTSSSRLSNVSTGRKKGSTNISKTDDEKVDGKKLFSNKEINVRQHGHLVQLILTPSTPVSGIRNAITIQVMNEMREALSILKNDEDCRVVLFTSTGTSFCEGLELSTLLHSNKDERKVRAEEVATAIKNFIKELATFNKPIVAGVQGAAIGLGVTMLPLFDLVIASDKATFNTPYGKLGQIAEGAAVLTLSHSLGSAVTNELLLGGRVLTASEALRAGLVTRVLWPDRFQGELLPSLKAMSEQSSQSMEATKALLRHSLRQKLEIALESESQLLIEHWCSQECQEAIKVYIEEKGQ